MPDTQTPAPHASEPTACYLCPAGHPDGLRHSIAEIRAYELGRRALDVPRPARVLVKFDRTWPVGEKHKAHYHEVPEDVFAEQIAVEYALLPEPSDG